MFVVWTSSTMVGTNKQEINKMNISSSTPRCRQQSWMFSVVSSWCSSAAKCNASEDCCSGTTKGCFYSALSSKSSNDKMHTLTRHYTAQTTWPSMWNHYAGFFPPAECSCTEGPTYYSPDVSVIHHCLPYPHHTSEGVWSMAPYCLCAGLCVEVSILEWACSLDPCFFFSVSNE